MKIKAYAKINLALYVTSKRDDGFHNIETIFLETDAFDELTISKSDTLEVTCSNLEIPSGEGNIVYVAADKLRKAFGIKTGALIHIEKNIPHGGGLGGGSADAASAVKALVKFWKIEDKNNLIKKVLEETGSDVPFCYLGGVALGQGRGEILKSLPAFLDYDIVLANLGIHISTKEAYNSLRIKLTTRLENVNLLVSYKELLDGKIKLKDFIYNDFEEYAEGKYPKITSLKNDLYNLGAEGVLMSGSGSTVFGLFKKGTFTESMQSKLKKEVSSLFVTTIKKI